MPQDLKFRLRRIKFYQRTSLGPSLDVLMLRGANKVDRTRCPL